MKKINIIMIISFITLTVSCDNESWTSSLQKQLKNGNKSQGEKMELYQYLEMIQINQR
ncbi:hypothetical protein F0310_04280 (plasmid) [Borrelia sp. A-FGy1]|nr:hypothetical protein F0310_04280 [Borrelia sp. A-FGy1]